MEGTTMTIAQTKEIQVQMAKKNALSAAIALKSLVVPSKSLLNLPKLA